MTNNFKNKIILVTGGTGSIGSELVKHLLQYQPKQIRVLSRDESRQYYLQEKLNYPKNLRLLIGDVRDKERLDLAFENVEIIFHAAALKHVPFCEYNPFEALKTNITGSQNVIEMALKHRVKKVIAISTDKAVNPTNILGTTKLMMEKLFTSVYAYSGGRPTKFSCVRFGNITWARGSVFDLWKKQANTNQTIRLTNNQMTRFYMSCAQAIKLILTATTLTQGGEIFVLKMPSIKLGNLAKMFIKKYFPSQKIKIKIIGIRPGEKIHEELFTANDKVSHVYENKEMFIITPRLDIYNLEEELNKYPGFRKVSKIKTYSSANQLKPKEIEKII